jgi:hypothetical protein
LNRRTFLKSSTAGLAAFVAFPKLAQARAFDRGWFSGYGAADGTFGVVHIDEDLSFRPVLSSAKRLHQILIHPNRAEICAPARRPENEFWVVNKEGVKLTRSTPENRHCFGHGVYSPDGSRLFVAENDFDYERGVIGVYDTEDKYNRVGEFPSGGIGPHEIKLLPGGQHLAIANGGILTHPQTGRAKLNLDTMQPNLTIIDLKTHQIIDRVQLSGGFHQQSIRHIDVAHDGIIVFGVQSQQRPYDEKAMVGAWLPGTAPRLFQAPRAGWGQLKGYVGSIALDISGSIVAAASPRGGIVSFWDINSGEFRGDYRSKDVCGVARTTGPDQFIATTGQGQIFNLSVNRHDINARRLVSSALRFDNHCNPMKRQLA